MSKYTSVQVHLSDNADAIDQATYTPTGNLKLGRPTLIDINNSELRNKMVYAIARFKNNDLDQQSEWCDIRSFKVSPDAKAEENGPSIVMCGWSYLHEPNKSHAPWNTQNNKWIPDQNYELNRYDSILSLYSYLNHVNYYFQRLLFTDVNAFTPNHVYFLNPSVPNNQEEYITPTNRARKLKRVSAVPFNILLLPCLVVTGENKNNYHFTLTANPSEPVENINNRIGYSAFYYSILEANQPVRNKLYLNNLTEWLPASVELKNNSSLETIPNNFLGDKVNKFYSNQEVLSGISNPLYIPYYEGPDTPTDVFNNLKLKDIGLTGSLYLNVRYQDPKTNPNRHQITTLPVKKIVSPHVIANKDAHESHNKNYFVRNAKYYPAIHSESELKSMFPGDQWDKITGTYLPTRYLDKVKLSPFPDLILAGVTNRFIVDGEVDPIVGQPILMVTLASSDPLVKFYLSSAGVESASTVIRFNFNDKPEICTLVSENTDRINAVYVRININRYASGADINGVPTSSDIKIIKLRPVIREYGFSSHFQDEVDYLLGAYVKNSNTHRSQFINPDGGDIDGQRLVGSFSFNTNYIGKSITSSILTPTNDGIKSNGDVVSTNFFTSSTIHSGYDNLTALGITVGNIPETGFTGNTSVGQDIGLPLLCFGVLNSGGSVPQGFNTRAIYDNNIPKRIFELNKLEMGSVNIINRWANPQQPWASYRLAPIPSADIAICNKLLSLPLQMDIIPLILDEGEVSTDKEQVNTFLAFIDGQAMHVITDHLKISSI